MNVRLMKYHEWTLSMSDGKLVILTDSCVMLHTAAVWQVQLTISASTTCTTFVQRVCNI